MCCNEGHDAPVPGTVVTVPLIASQTTLFSHDKGGEAVNSQTASDQAFDRLSPQRAEVKSTFRYLR